MNAVGIDFFERQWATYHAIVVHDLMEHQALLAACASTLETWLQRRRLSQPVASPPAMVDLGCGDLTTLAPLLRHLPLGSYTGLDLTATVLPLAAATLGPVPYPTHWSEGDLLKWATSGADDNTPIDILHSAFAIHHLNDEEKVTVLRGARTRIHQERFAGSPRRSVGDSGSGRSQRLALELGVAGTARQRSPGSAHSGLNARRLLRSPLAAAAL